jgi:hypothetical protein
MSASAKAGVKGQLTVNLALFFLVLQADEDRIILGLLCNILKIKG